MIDIIYKNIDDLTPYENNPRKNDNAVDIVARSIKDFGFKIPIVLDKNGVIVAGHTRLKAAKKLKLEKVPCVIADDLTEEQIKAFRIADNRTSEIATWDFEKLELEINSFEILDMQPYGFEKFGSAEELKKREQEWFEKTKEERNENDEEDEEYNDFVDKFKEKKTTDDCYTPDEVYEIVADFVSNKYGISRDKFVRPFYPGGDYRKYKYSDDSVVVDNPPFSIMSEIIDFYNDNNIKFYLFCDGRTIVTKRKLKNACAIFAFATVKYENGAEIRTSFITNLENECIVRTEKDLKDKLEALNKTENNFKKWIFPEEVIAMKDMLKATRIDMDFEIKKENCYVVEKLDNQEKDERLFGGALLVPKKVSEKFRIDIAERERERERGKKVELSEREKEIVEKLGEAYEEKRSAK